MKYISLLPFAMPIVVCFLGYIGCNKAANILDTVGTLTNQHSGELNNPILNPQNWNQGTYQGPSGRPVSWNQAPNGQGQPNYPNQAQYGGAQGNYGQNGSGMPAGNGQQTAAPPTNHTIRLASFNIQAFGPSKMSDQVLMQRLAAVISHFDVIAIQEIRSNDQNLMNVLLNYVNAQGLRYSYLLGPRLGRTTSKEQYAYVYNTQTIATAPDQSYTINDAQDLLHREPMVARFAVIGTAPCPPFTFTMANVHTDPDEIAQEVPVLASVFQSIAAFEAGVAREDDILMVGDFNASASQLASVATQQQYVPTITNVATNVAGNKQYDNILLNPAYTAEFTGNCGVFDMGAFFNISREEVLRISDHLPVWAEFRVYEATQQSYAQQRY